MKIRQDKDKYNIGTNIRKFRKSQKMTQEQVVAYKHNAPNPSRVKLMTQIF